MTHRIAFLFQFFLFVLYEIGICELIILKLEEILVLPVVGNSFSQGFQILADRLVFIVCLLILGEWLGIICDDIHHTQLEVLFIQQKVLVLRMDVDKLFTKFFQQIQLYGGVVDKGTALTCTRQFTSDDTVCRIVFDIILIEEGLQTIT